MAVTTAEGVANQALYLIGEKGEITDLTGGTDELSKLCNMFYEDTRDEVSRILPWSCLKTETALSLSAASNSVFTNYHTLAATVLTVLNINGDEDAEFARHGSTLYVTATSGYFVHTAKESDPTNWEPLLLTAVTELLASRICVRRTGSPQTALLLYQQYLATLLAAVKLNYVEGDTGEWLEMIAAMSQYVPTDLLAARTKVTI